MSLLTAFKTFQLFFSFTTTKKQNKQKRNVRKLLPQIIPITSKLSMHRNYDNKSIGTNLFAEHWYNAANVAVQQLGEM